MKRGTSGGRDPWVGAAFCAISRTAHGSRTIGRRHPALLVGLSWLRQAVERFDLIDLLNAPLLDPKGTPNQGLLLPGATATDNATKVTTNTATGRVTEEEVSRVTALNDSFDATITTSRIASTTTDSEGNVEYSPTLSTTIFNNVVGNSGVLTDEKTTTTIDGVTTVDDPPAVEIENDYQETIGDVGFGPENFGTLGFKSNPIGSPSFVSGNSGTNGSGDPGGSSGDDGTSSNDGGNTDDSLPPGSYVIDAFDGFRTVVASAGTDTTQQLTVSEDAENFDPMKYQPRKEFVDDPFLYSMNSDGSLNEWVYSEAIFKGLKTGLKANWNSSTDTIIGLFTLGYHSGDTAGINFAVTEDDLGYHLSYGFQRGGKELILGLGTGALSKVSYVGKPLLALDLSGGAASFGRGAVDAYQNGYNTGNAMQMGFGLFSVAGNAAVLAKPSPNARSFEPTQQNWIRCFSRSTLVSTESGLRPIGEVEAGDLVYAFNFELGKWELKRGEERLDNFYEGTVVTLGIGGDEIETTVNHPFWVVSGEDLASRSIPTELEPGENEGQSLTGRWVNSHELRVGDELIDQDGRRQIVTKVSRRKEDKFEVSNLTIETLHNYAVGQLRILVHNTSICDETLDMVREGKLTLRKMVEDAVKKGVELDDINDALARLGTGSKLKNADFVALGKLHAPSGGTTLSRETSERILAIPKGKRPDPSTYMSQADIDAHLKLFDDGAVRFTSRASAKRYGTVGPDGGFVMPKSEFDRVLKEANGNLRVVEQKLGLDAGYLSDADTMAVLIKRDQMKGLRVPSGNEGGAHEVFWRPGGYTSGGVAEAVMDFSHKPHVTEIILKRN